MAEEVPPKLKSVSSIEGNCDINSLNIDFKVNKSFKINGHDFKGTYKGDSMGTRDYFNDVPGIITLNGLDIPKYNPNDSYSVSNNNGTYGTKEIEDKVTITKGINNSVWLNGRTQQIIKNNYFYIESDKTSDNGERNSVKITTHYESQGELVKTAPTINLKTFGENEETYLSRTTLSLNSLNTDNPGIQLHSNFIIPDNEFLLNPISTDENINYHSTGISFFGGKTDEKPLQLSAGSVGSVFQKEIDEDEKYVSPFYGIRNTLHLPYDKIYKTEKETVDGKIEEKLVKQIDNFHGSNTPWTNSDSFITKPVSAILGMEYYPFGKRDSKDSEGVGKDIGVIRTNCSIWPDDRLDGNQIATNGWVNKQNFLYAPKNVDLTKQYFYLVNPDIFSALNIDPDDASKPNITYSTSVISAAKIYAGVSLNGSWGHKGSSGNEKLLLTTFKVIGELPTKTVDIELDKGVYYITVETVDAGYRFYDGYPAYTGVDFWIKDLDKDTPSNATVSDGTVGIKEYNNIIKTHVFAGSSTFRSDTGSNNDEDHPAGHWIGNGIKTINKHGTYTCNFKMFSMFPVKFENNNVVLAGPNLIFPLVAICVKFEKIANVID